jgi:phosphomannomutase
MDVAQLKISESGIRGVAGTVLTPDLAVRCAGAFGQGKQRVLVAMDTRRSGVFLKHAVLSGLLAAGSSPVDGGVIPTPTAQIVVKNLELDGGIVITASHNPDEWNALKFIGEDGCFVAGDEVRDLCSRGLRQDFRWMPCACKCVVTKRHDLASYHVSHILGMVAGNKIRSRRLRVGVDTSNGACLAIARELLITLGCELEVLHQSPQPVTYLPEERSRHFKRLSDRVLTRKCAVGFGLDPDGDRLTLVDEMGVVHREDFTLALLANWALERTPGAVVVNDCTSAAVAEVVSRHGVPLIRAAVGERNVVERMHESGAVIGGEGNGGVIFPKLHYGRDGVAAMAAVLDTMAHTDRKLSELLKPYGKWQTSRFVLEDGKNLLEELNRALGGKFEGVPASSGFRFEAGKSWVSLRRSNTEPILRVIAESTDEGFLQAVEQVVREVTAPRRSTTESLRL